MRTASERDIACGTQTTCARHPLILLISTMPWMFPARLADAFWQSGFQVATVCHWGHPMRCLSQPIRAHRLGWLAEVGSIEEAIRHNKPDLVVPCDDPAVRALHHLHRHSQLTNMAALIERSLGDPAGFVTTEKRSALIGLARSMGLLVPRSEIVARSGLAAAAARIGYPCVLKRDLTWGGMGAIVVCSEAGLPRGWANTAGWMAILRAGKAVLRDRRPHNLIDVLANKPAVEAQEFLEGKPANRAVLCRAGKVIAGLSVEALHTAYPGGPASVVRVIDHKEMSDAVEALVGRLGLSGFCGFDFLIAPSGRAYLLELNPRATPVAHLPVADGTHLPTSLYRDMTGREPLYRTKAIPGELIALFPTEWQRDRASRFLDEAHHDFPRDQPVLLAKAGLAHLTSRRENAYEVAARQQDVSPLAD